MNKSIKAELLSHVISTIEDQELTTFGDLHFHAFNEDYYLIGYWNCKEWVKNHGLDAFDVISEVLTYQLDNYGEHMIQADKIDAESIVNLYVYQLGEDLLSDYDLEIEAAELLAELREDLEGCE